MCQANLLPPLCYLQRTAAFRVPLCPSRTEGRGVLAVGEPGDVLQVRAPARVLLRLPPLELRPAALEKVAEKWSAEERWNSRRGLRIDLQTMS